MSIKKNIKKYIALSLIIAISISVISCDFEVTTNESDLYGNKATVDRVKINIEEAKVLSSIAILNENVILLSGLATEKNSTFSVKNVSKKLEKQHRQIKNKLNDLAENKLILLPNKLDKNDINTLHYVEDEDFNNAYLDKVETLLKNEIAQLEYLSTITNDVDFKVFTIRILDDLNFSLTQINKIN